MTKKVSKKFFEMIRHFFLFKIGAYLRVIRKPRFPHNTDEKILIHIGCGDFNDSRFINIDTRPGLHIHIVDTIEHIHKAVPKNYGDLIYACHILEHIPYATIPRVLEKLRSRLKKGGILRLSVPNFAIIIEMYQEKYSIEDILPPLMGGQGYPDNFHRAALDEKYLKTLLLNAGFQKVRKWTPEKALYHSFDDWAGRSIDLYGKKWPISLNLEAIK